MTRARRHNSHLIVHGHLLVGGVEIRIVAAGAAHSRSQVIRDQESGHSRKVFKSMNVSADPGGQLLVSGSFRVSVGTRAQHHHEQRRWPDFAGNRIVHRNRGTGPVHETLLARLVYLAKNYILLSCANVGRARRSDCSRILADESAGTLPKPAATSDGDAAATERARRKNPGGLVRGVVLSPAALRTMPARRAARPSLPESARLSRPPPLSSGSYGRLPD